MKKIILKKPLNVDGTEIKAITLREPTAEDAVGFNIHKLFAGETDEILHFTARISNPPLPRALAGSLSLYDLSSIVSAVQSFFIDESDILEAMAEMTSALTKDAEATEESAAMTA